LIKSQLLYRWATHPLIKSSYQTFDFRASVAAKKLAATEIVWWKRFDY